MEGEEGVGYIHGMYRVGRLGCGKVLKITRHHRFVHTGRLRE